MARGSISLIRDFFLTLAPVLDREGGTGWPAFTVPLYLLTLISCPSPPTPTNQEESVTVTKQVCDQRREAAARHQGVSSGHCDHLEGWEREGERETQEGGDMGIYVYV